jgi:hypothetical protein
MSASSPRSTISALMLGATTTMPVPFKERCKAAVATLMWYFFKAASKFVASYSSSPRPLGASPRPLGV